MSDLNDLVFYIVIRKSLQLDVHQIALCAANAVQHLLLKYFTMQVLAVKLKSDILAHECLVTNTQSWLNHKATKQIKLVDDNVLDQLKHEFAIGRVIFSIKENNQETGLFFLPEREEKIPAYLKDI